MATRAGSRPVGVGPAGSTCVGNREGKTFVGDAGGNLSIGLEESQDGAATASSSTCWLAVSASRALRATGAWNQC